MLSGDYALLNILPEPLVECEIKSRSPIVVQDPVPAIHVFHKHIAWASQHPVSVAFAQCPDTPSFAISFREVCVRALHMHALARNVRHVDFLFLSHCFLLLDLQIVSLSDEIFPCRCSAAYVSAYASSAARYILFRLDAFPETPFTHAS